MGKVVDHRDAVNFAANFATPPDALESRERRGDSFTLNPPGISGNDRRQAVTYVEIADQRRLKFAPFQSLMKDPKASSPLRVVNVARLPTGVLTRAKRFHFREQLSLHRRDYLVQMWTVPAGNQTPIARHQVHQPATRQ